MIDATNYTLPENCYWRNEDKMSICCYEYSGANDNRISKSGCFDVNLVNVFIHYDIVDFCTWSL
jgi:hypothetical protein